MRITQLTLKNLRCFGPEPVTIDLDSLTAIIGTNGCGKTAALVALARLFGVSQTDRHLQPEDFHIPANWKRDELDQIDLMIEARIQFPELGFAPDDSAAIPPCFNQMVLGEDGDLFCRVRLEGKWTRSTLAEGDIEEKAYWITTAEEAVTEEDKRPMQAHERSMIHVLYVPAFRDASRQVAEASGSILYRLLRAIEWSDAVKKAVEDSAQSIRDSVQSEGAIQHLHECLGNAWRKLHDMPTFQTVAFQPVGGAIDELLKQVEVVFGPGGDGREHSIDRLSEGLKSLFYFSLVASLFQIEEEIKAKELRAATDTRTQATVGDAETAPSAGDVDLLGAFSADRLRPPALTIFAVEEPENHLSPHYLGRIMELLQSIATTGSGQVLLTSHSPAIMSRIDPERVRYLRLEPDSLTTRARRITLPPTADEAFKYVKEAVRAYPELYLARLVVLCEGDSEEVVIPRVAMTSGIAVDISLISVVPLGGRHVRQLVGGQHDQRLLPGLKEVAGELAPMGVSAVLAEHREGRSAPDAHENSSASNPGPAAEGVAGVLHFQGYRCLEAVLGLRSAGVLALDHPVGEPDQIADLVQGVLGCAVDCQHRLFPRP
ncbi:MAG: AAA family ATPase [Verrucomicrobiota bacterium]|jgi:energy-coupling factor transporter ATP-binding protein EcfA2